MEFSKVHCLFEQSGTFKNVFKELGFSAFDYDILNDFGQTDYVIDLFKEINNAYEGDKSIFDYMSNDDLLFAFFPCVRFESEFTMHILGNAKYMRSWTLEMKLKHSIKLIDEVVDMYKLISKLVLVCIQKNLKLIIENPYRENSHFLNRYWPFKSTIIDMNRSYLGDHFKKPTQYWFLNCEPLNNFDFGVDLRNYGELKKVHNCSTCERSMIDKTYAKNFICSFILDR